VILIRVDPDFVRGFVPKHAEQAAAAWRISVSIHIAFQQKRRAARCFHRDKRTRLALIEEADPIPAR